jgi:hypothetical protein
VSAGLGVALILGVSLAGLWVWSELEPGGVLAPGLPPLPTAAGMPQAGDTALVGTDGPFLPPADPGPVASSRPAASTAAALKPPAADTPKEQYKKRWHLAESPAIDPPALDPKAFSAAAPLSSPGLQPAPTSQVSPPALDPEASAQDDSEAQRESFSPEATGAARLAAPPITLPSAIRIHRSPPRDRLDPDLSEAYRAFQSGNPSRAETLYRRVYAREPDRRDAPGPDT